MRREEIRVGDRGSPGADGGGTGEGRDILIGEEGSPGAGRG